MENEVKLHIEGHLKVERLSPDGTRETIFDDHNTLTLNYPNVIRKALAGVASLDTLAARDSGDNVLAITPIDNVAYNSIVNYKATYSGTFNESSFTGTIAKLEMGDDIEGVFSEVTGLAISKTSSQQLQISWTLTIINNP